jgi:hypothetical protein
MMMIEHICRDLPFELDDCDGPFCYLIKPGNEEKFWSGACIGSQEKHPDQRANNIKAVKTF